MHRTTVADFRLHAAFGVQLVPEIATFFGSRSRPRWEACDRLRLHDVDLCRGFQRALLTKVKVRDLAVHSRPSCSSLARSRRARRHQQDISSADADYGLLLWSTGSHD